MSYCVSTLLRFAEAEGRKLYTCMHVGFLMQIACYVQTICMGISTLGCVKHGFMELLNSTPYHR